MTDGAARVLEIEADEELRREILPHLVSRDPNEMWTAGQWMTERRGGSDVSGIDTVAKRDGDAFRLYGNKWFTSATTSEIALTLAKIEGSSELSLFMLRLRDNHGRLRQIRIDRLKDKLGTPLLIEHAGWSLERENDIRPLISARRWCEEGLVRLLSPSESWSEESRSIALDDVD